MSFMYPNLGAPESGSIHGVLDDLVKVDGFASVLTEAFEAKLGQEETGVYVLKCMLQDGGAMRPRLSSAAERTEFEAMVVDMMAAAALGRLITEAIEMTQASDGLTDTRKVAVYILRTMKESRL
jgi:hypothetical protein